MNHIRPTFSIQQKTDFGRARLGRLKTSHGTVVTPAYVIVATKAEVKTLRPTDIKKTKTQIIIANTYHLWNKVNNDKWQMTNEAHGKSFIINNLKVSIPTMTDSGGFQVFSLGAAKDHKIGKIAGKVRGSSSRSNLSGSNLSGARITERGVHFLVDGHKRFLSPELSIKIQERLGADIIFAFDECTSPLHPQEYTKKSMERTHRWAKRCLKAHKRKDQMLYGIIQGGRFKRLRTASARIIGQMPFDGFGIGGSFGKDEMVKTLQAVVPYLPKDKPRHLLGIGTVADIFAAIEAGIDTFDCVIPTREARHARIYTDQGTLDIRKAMFANDNRRLNLSCRCPACLGGTTRTKLRGLFKNHNQQAGRLATLHNVFWFNQLLKRIRTALMDGSYRTFKRKFWATFLPTS